MTGASRRGQFHATELGPRAECSVRLATLDDMAAVTSIYAHFVESTTATLDLIAPGEATMRHRFEAVADSNLPYLVAELNGYIVGYCYAAPFRPRAGYRFTVEDSIYVRSDCRGYGVGKALLSELVARCYERNCHSMVAYICGVNAASTALHASLGFVPIGTLPEVGKKFGKWLSVLIMQLILVPTAHEPQTGQS